MDDVIGIRGWCKRCYYGKTDADTVICQNRESAFYGMQTNSILCAPCFRNDKTKEYVTAEPVGFSS